MNRNKKLRKKMMTGLAVGMAGIMGAMPVCAAEGTPAVTKEETVYVNAAADGSKTKVTVSDWLKNAGVENVLNDQSNLTGIVNVKGNETFAQNNDTLTWNTNGKDIYYQGTSEKELPVEVKFTYYLDGKEITPSELAGKSGKLKIRIDYTNHAKQTTKINGKKEDIYSPFVMVTGMILPEEKFSNVVIDNGKVISDGDRNIVLGVGMPGMKESLGLDEEEAASAIEDIRLPESLEITADVTNFSMDPTFTVALSDLLEDLNLNDTDSLDDVMDSLNDLEEAALKLVDGSTELSNGANKLGSSYAEFDQGIGTLKKGIDALNLGANNLSKGIQQYTNGADTLNAGIQKYMGKDGALNVQVTEYVNGVNKVVKGVEDYTAGTVSLADGVTNYVAGEEQIANGAKQLSTLQSGLVEIKSAITALHNAVDGKGETTEDIYVASQTLAKGTEKLNQSIEEMSALMMQVDKMTAAGKKLTEQAGTMSQTVQTQILVPTEKMLQAGNQLMGKLQAVSGQLAKLKEGCQAAVKQATVQVETAANAQIESRNQQITKAKKSAVESNQKIDASIAALNAQIVKAKANGDHETANALTETVRQLSTAKVDVNNLQTLEKVNVGEVNVNIPVPDFSELMQTADSMKTEFEKIQTSFNGIAPTIQEMNKQLEQISSIKVPAKPMEQLKAGVAELNTGMQKLNGAIGVLSTNVGMLDQKTDSLPEAIKGIDALTSGLDALTQANPMLLQGAQLLKENTGTLVDGVHTLAGGTEQLSQGLGTLGTELSNGSASLAMNSEALREGATKLLSGTDQLVLGSGTLQTASGQVKDGISALQNGALQLKNGTVEFNNRGIKKLQETADDLLGSLLDRVDALTSDTCSYDSYAGKAEGMDGSVKFVIETEGIE